jgi:predicted transposase YbfD/YdcC
MERNPERSPKPLSLVECFAAVPDPRVNRTREHKLIDILVIGICSMLTVGEDFTDMEFIGRTRRDWFKSFLELPNDIPSHDTFNRVFAALDPHCFLDCFVRWVGGACAALKGTVVAIDGKTLRRAADEGNPLPHIVSAWAVEAGLTLGQVKVDDKSNEITAIPELLAALALKGCIVTIDAMGCQKEIAAAIVDKGADYVLTLKGNQGVAHGEIKEYFDDAIPPGTRKAVVKAGAIFDFRETLDKGHGRIELRRYWQSVDIGWFQDLKRWKGLTSIGMVESRRTVKGKRAVERRYYLSSLPLNAAKFAQAVRQHWSIENPLHWSLDVTFREDQSRARTKYAAQNLATLRRLALNLIRNDKTMNVSVKKKRALAAFDPDYLKRLLGI